MLTLFKLMFSSMPPNEHDSPTRIFKSITNITPKKGFKLKYILFLLIYKMLYYNLPQTRCKNDFCYSLSKAHKMVCKVDLPGKETTPALLYILSFVVLLVIIRFIIEGKCFLL